MGNIFYTNKGFAIWFEKCPYNILEGDGLVYRMLH
jgi:hypothetical protein